MCRTPKDLRQAMKTIEKTIIGKKNEAECEDGIVVNDNFVAVVDGSTSKTPMQLKKGCNNGRYCMELICRYIEEMPEDISANEFCNEITQQIRSVYEEYGVDIERLRQNPTERLTASAIIYSAYHKEIWMVGDCQCIANGQVYDNSKPQESILADKRSRFLKQAITDGLTLEEAQTKDPGRTFILKELIECCKEQNISYSVIDGFNIPLNKIKVIDVSQEKEIILASDGYPFLKPTLKDSEEALKKLLDNDPLLINLFKATKGFYKGNLSFDDRSYIRFSV